MNYEEVIRGLIERSDYTDDEKANITQFFNGILEDCDWLYCLQAAGVDNWSGYDYAREIQESEE